jgi:hypothetical protein
VVKTDRQWAYGVCSAQTNGVPTPKRVYIQNRLPDVYCKKIGKNINMYFLGGSSAESQSVKCMTSEINTPE